MAFTFLAWLPWAWNAMITFRSATLQSLQVEHVALPDWAGHNRTLVPSGVLRGTGWSLGTTTTAGRPKETAWSASLNDSVLALIVNPCSLLRLRIGRLCLLSVWCVYVYPLRFVLETTRWAIIPWSMSPNWCGKSVLGQNHRDLANLYRAHHCWPCANEGQAVLILHSIQCWWKDRMEHMILALKLWPALDRSWNCQTLAWCGLSCDCDRPDVVEWLPMCTQCPNAMVLSSSKCSNAMYQLIKYWVEWWDRLVWLAKDN